MKLTFQTQNGNEDFAELRKSVNQLKRNANMKRISLNSLIFGSVLFITFNLFIILFWRANEYDFCYLLISSILGMLCVPMILVIGHEAIHGNFTHNKRINQLAKNIFIFLGTSAYFWELRHLNAHHNYTNVAEWDLDIEQSPLIRLSDKHKFKRIHRYQQVYMPFLFMLYTLNWFFFRDFKDLSLCKFGSKEVKKHPSSQILLMMLGKIWHLVFLIGIPLFVGQSLGLVICGFFIFHFSASLTTTLVLISTHIGEEHELLGTNEESKLPYSWVEHQIRTSGDFSTHSVFALHFFGGFNHHLSHHLFPDVPYVLYPKITPLIKSYCEVHQLPYHHYPNLITCMKSHFLRLRKFSIQQS